jgi:hypothetical protein
MTPRLAPAAAVLIAIAVAGCGSSAPVDLAAASSYRSPEQATLSWFYAINHKDRAAADAHFEKAAGGQMDWGDGDTSTWPVFSALRCQPASQQATSASVYCTFSESQAASAGNPDSFWTVWLQRHPDGRWLISNYGQG